MYNPQIFMESLMSNKPVLSIDYLDYTLHDESLLLYMLMYYLIINQINH